MNEEAVISLNLWGSEWDEQDGVSRANQAGLLLTEHPLGGGRSIVLLLRTWDPPDGLCVSCSTKEYSVIFGTSKLMPLTPQEPSWSLVRDIIMHPKYWGRTFIKGDVALFQLYNPVIAGSMCSPSAFRSPTTAWRLGQQHNTGCNSLQVRRKGVRVSTAPREYTTLLGSCLLSLFMVLTTISCFLWPLVLWMC